MTLRKIDYRNTTTKRRETLLPFLSVFLLVAVRYLYFGFRYFPQLDDYIQYHNYAQQGSVFYLIEKLGLLAARPLAGLFDITLWSWLWPCMILSVLLLSALYAASAVTFKNLFAKLFGTSGFFFVIYALMPLGIEGTYWVSASSRIIPGLLFAALSASCFQTFLDGGRKAALIRALAFQFLTFCFYEQAAVLSCALNVLLALLAVKKSDYRWVCSFLCIVTAGLYFGLCKLAGPSPLYDGRTNIMLPASAYYFDTFLPDLLSQMKSAFLGGGFYILVYGFIRGLLNIVSDGAWVYCVALLLFVLFFAFVQFGGENKKERGKLLAPLWFGILLAIAPLAPFFIIENPWFSIRGTVTSYVGIALVADLVMRLIFGGRRRVIGALGSLLALVFCICSVSELADYKANYEADSRAVGAVAAIAEDYPDGGKVAILNLSDTYVVEQNYKFHEHITGVTESSWALTGAVRCHNDNQAEWITYVPIPLDEPCAYAAWEYEEKTLYSMDGVYCYDADTGSVAPLRVEYAGDGQFLLYHADGSLYGRIEEKDRIGYFFEE